MSVGPRSIRTMRFRKKSLSDRFGLWLGFHGCSQEDYLAMVIGYAEHFGPSPPGRRARGARTGDDPGLALGAHRLAIHPGSCRQARQGYGGMLAGCVHALGVL